MKYLKRFNESFSNEEVEKIVSLINSDEEENIEIALQIADGFGININEYYKDINISLYNAYKFKLKTKEFNESISFGQDDYDDFIEFINNKRKEGINIIWTLCDNRKYWDMYIRNGSEFVVFMTNNKQKGKELIGVSIDNKNNIIDAYYNDDTRYIV